MRFLNAANVHPHALAAADGQLFIELLPWLIALMVLVLIGGISIYAARRFMQNSDNASHEGFTLHSLRQLHAEGKLSDEEFQRAKQAMIGSVRGAAEPEIEPETSDSTDNDAKAGS